MKQLYKLLFSIAIFLIINSGNSCYAQTPSWLWASKGHPSGPVWVTGTSADASGNSFTAGYSVNGIQFGSMLGLTRGGFIVKYNPQGIPVWAVHIDNAYPSAIATDANGNSYVTGYFFDTLRIGSHQLICKGFQDIFLIRVDSAGLVEWAERAGGIGYPPSFVHLPPIDEDRAHSLAIDAAGNCYIGATVIASDTSAADFDSVAVRPPVPSLIPRRLNVLAKYHKSGRIQWVRSTNVSFPIYRALAVTGQGSCVAIGMFNNTLTLGQTTLVSQGQADICLISYDPNGNLSWAKRFGGSGLDYGSDITLDNAGNIVITGAFENSIQFGAHVLTSSATSGVLYLTKLDSTGNVLWASQATGSYSSQGLNVVLDPLGNSYVNCMFSGQVQFGSQTFNTPFAGDYDLVVSKWNAAGVPVWALAAQGSGDDYPQGLAYDPASGGCYVSGVFDGSLTFGGTSLGAGSWSNFFLAKLGSSVTGVAEQQAIGANWMVHPNPALQNFSVKLNRPGPPAKGKFLLYNSTGRLVKELSFNNVGEIQVERQNLPAGLYLYKIKTGKNEDTSGKIVLQ